MLYYNRKSSEVFANLDDDEKWPILDTYESGLNLDTCFTYYLNDLGIQNAKEGIYNLK